MEFGGVLSDPLGVRGLKSLSEDPGNAMPNSNICLFFSVGITLLMLALINAPCCVL